MKFEKYLITEASSKVGDWLEQKRRDATVYAVVVELQKNGGAKVLMIDDSYGVAKMGSTKNWNPSPVASSMSKVPSTELKKLKTKLTKTKYKDMKLS